MNLAVTEDKTGRALNLDKGGRCALHPLSHQEV